MVKRVFFTQFSSRAALPFVIRTFHRGAKFRTKVDFGFTDDKGRIVRANLDHDALSVTDLDEKRDDIFNLMLAQKAAMHEQA